MPVPVEDMSDRRLTRALACGRRDRASLNTMRSGRDSADIESDKESATEKCRGAGRRSVQVKLVSAKYAYRISVTTSVRMSIRSIYLFSASCAQPGNLDYPFRHSRDDDSLPRYFHGLLRLYFMLIERDSASERDSSALD